MRVNRPSRVDQLLSGFALGDAISTDAIGIRKALSAHGVEGACFAPAALIAPESVHACSPIEEFDAAAADVVLLHDAMSEAAVACFSAARGRRVLRYHNITPARWFAPFDAVIAESLAKARSRLREVCSDGVRVLADSDYNAGELRALGAADVRVLPLCVRPDGLRVEPDAATLERFGGPLLNILFVGRLAPNKSIETLIEAFAVLHRRIDARSRLILVGSPHGCPAYVALLRALTGRLDLPNVCFTDFVTEAQKAAYYRCARLFVTASRHEGYCLPLIEALAAGVPVLARRQGGMPEALDGAGIMFDEETPAELAELIYFLCSDEDMRREVLSAQARRIAALDTRDLAGECLAALEGWA